MYTKNREHASHIKIYKHIELGFEEWKISFQKFSNFYFRLGMEGYSINLLPVNINKLFITYDTTQ